MVCPAGVPHAEAFVRRSDSYRLGWWSLNTEDPTLHVTRYSRREGFKLEHRMSLAVLPAEARRRLGRLREMAEGEGAIDVNALREAMMTLALALIRRVLDGGSAQMDTRELLVQRATKFVRANGGQALSLAEVAHAVHVSPNYLTGLFRAVTGKSLGRFIMDERMVKAQKLLEAGSGSVKEVAAELGFSDTYTFSRAFKRFSGRSPTHWLVSRGA